MTPYLFLVQSSLGMKIMGNIPLHPKMECQVYPARVSNHRNSAIAEGCQILREIGGRESVDNLSVGH